MKKHGRCNRVRITRAKGKGMRIGQWNVRGARGIKLQAIAKAAKESKVDILCISETNITGHYTSTCCDYTVVASKANSEHQGGVAIFYKTSDRWN